LQPIDKRKTVILIDNLCKIKAWTLWVINFVCCIMITNFMVHTRYWEHRWSRNSHYHVDKTLLLDPISVKLGRVCRQEIGSWNTLNWINIFSHIH
jgi:hypothetical protein